jgi:hypothetical protein
MKELMKHGTVLMNYMHKERNEIGKDVVERSKTTKASPRCLLNFLKKMNRRSRKMN